MIIQKREAALLTFLLGLMLFGDAIANWLVPLS